MTLRNGFSGDGIRDASHAAANPPPLKILRDNLPGQPFGKKMSVGDSESLSPPEEGSPERRKGPVRPQPNNPLHGVTLKFILSELVEKLGWEEVSRATGIRNFTDRPTLPSGLKFLRKTPWAREKVEAVYLHELCKKTMVQPVERE